MMGWIALALIAGMVGISLFLLGVSRALATLVGAALMLGATGYALTGSPGQSDAPVKAEKKDRDINTELVRLREDMFGQITFGEIYLKASDAMMARGNTAYGVQAIIGGLYKSPNDASLWTGLGLAYQEHDGGQLSPAAELAFNRAMQLAPEHPGPYFFYGMALIRSGDFKAAQGVWRKALRLAPQGTAARQDIAIRLKMLNLLLRQMALQERAKAGAGKAQ